MAAYTKSDDAEKVSKQDKDEILERGKRLFKLSSEAFASQRKREKEDLEFQVPENQWSGEVRQARSGQMVGNITIPERPMLSINKLDQPIQLVLNQERAAKLGVNVHPISEDANEETAEVIQGIYRGIERGGAGCPAANIARSWAFNRAVDAGWGVYRIGERYDEAGGNPFDQIITIERVLYQEEVYLDPAAKEPDFSDGQFAFQCGWINKTDFERRYPGKRLPSEDQAFMNDGEETPLWVKGEGDDCSYRIAEHWYKKYEMVKIFLGADGLIYSNGESKRYPELPDDMVIVDEREYDECTLYRCVLSAIEVLEDPEECDGELIPLVPVIGKELIPFGPERHWVGVIGPAKDGQRLYNYAVSTAVEIAALEPKAPWIGVEGQFAGNLAMWQQANVRNFPFLEYTNVSLNGQPAPPPQRVQVDASRLGASLALVNQANNDIQSSTQTFDPSLGRTNPKERSGRALMALQEQSDAANSHYLHNMADISMAYEARVVLERIPRKYDRPGRIARILDAEDNSESVMLNRPYYMDPRVQRPMAAPIDKRTGQPMPPQGSKVVQHMLTEGTYGVTVTIGKSYQSMRQQATSEIGEIITARPELMPIIGPIYFKNSDIPGANEIADLLTKERDHAMPWLSEPKDGEEPTPEQMKSENQALKQQNQQLQQQVQQAAMAIQTEQAKQQAGLQKAQMDNQTKLEVEKLKAQVQLLIQRGADETKVHVAAMDHAAQNREGQEERAHDVALEVAKAELAPIDLNPAAGGGPLPSGDERV